MNVYVKKQNTLLSRMFARIAILVILLIILNVFESQIKNIFYSTSAPLMNVFKQSGSAVYNSFQSAFSFGSLKQENSNLKEENQNLLSQVSLLQSYLRQGQSVQDALQSVQGEGLNILRARLVGLDSTNDYILIDKGSKDRISEGMPIISSQNVLFGNVIKVYDHYSQVMLISNKNSVLDIRIQDDDPAKLLIHGVVKGNKNLSVYLDLVNPDAEIKEGNVLVTSGLQTNIPANLLVGKITSITKDDLKPFQTATVNPLFDVKSADNVFVVINPIKK